MIIKALSATPSPSCPSLTSFACVSKAACVAKQSTEYYKVKLTSDDLS